MFADVFRKTLKLLVQGKMSRQGCSHLSRHLNGQTSSAHQLDLVTLVADFLAKTYRLGQT